MTDEEQHRIIGRVFSERKVARRQLACLKSKKAHMIREITVVRDEYLDGETPHPGKEYTIPFPTLDDVFTLTKELRKAKSRLSDLEKQCRAFGLD